MSEVLQDFLSYIEQCRNVYQTAREIVSLEDKRLQDLLHELEFSADENEKRRAATKLMQSRRERRQYKDEVKRYGRLVEFFNEPAQKNMLHKMYQLLGQQRKEEEYLNGERTYYPRVPKQTKDGENECNI